MTPEQEKLLREDEPLYPYRHPNYGSHDWLKLVTVLRQRLIEARERSQKAEARNMQYENDEASVCPEDVGFVEWIGVLTKRAKQTEAERDALKAWKKSAIAVEAEWDAQAVGRELGIGLGQSIRAGILPKVLALKAELAEAHQAMMRAEILFPSLCFKLLNTEGQCIDAAKETPNRCGKSGPDHVPDGSCCID